MADVREIKESPLVQGEDEEIAYELTTTPWGSSPSNVSVVVKDESAGGTDVTDTVTSGSSSVSDDVITTPTIDSLTASHIYRLEIKFTISGNVVEAFAIIRAQE